MNWTTCVSNLANKRIIVNYTIGPNTISESGMAGDRHKPQRGLTSSDNVEEQGIDTSHREG